jgi:hypothetical protein
MPNRNIVAPREPDPIASMRLELAALDAMTVGELAEKYLEVVGAPTRSRNKGYLRRHIAWQIQERVEGGLSPRALERIEQLAPHAPARWRRPIANRPDAAAPSSAPSTVKHDPDPRLPAVGETLTRLYDGIEHRVTVLASGFEYQGQPYRSLSKIAAIITGKSWNGYVFFLGRDKRTPGASEGGAR